MRPPGPPEQLQQRPKRGAVERDEAAIDRWEWEEWPWIKPRYTTWGPSRRPRWEGRGRGHPTDASAAEPTTTWSRSSGRPMIPSNPKAWLLGWWLGYRARV